MKLPIFFRQLELGPMQNYVYLLGDPTTREAAVVDAAWDIDAIVAAAEAEGYKITAAQLEKAAPWGGWMGRATGAVMIAWGAATLLTAA